MSNHLKVVLYKDRLIEQNKVKNEVVGDYFENGQPGSNFFKVLFLSSNNFKIEWINSFEFRDKSLII